MVWRRATGRRPGHALFSDHPTNIWSVAVLVLISGGVGALLCSAFHLFLPRVAPLICGVGAVAAMFAVVFLAIHVLRWVEPIALAKTVYLLGVLLLGGVFGFRAYQGVPPLPGTDLGGFGAAMIVLIVAALPAMLALLAIGDRAPPVDESRLGESPHL